MCIFKSRGFTLIELLIVVAIIAILAAIAVPNFLEAQMRSKVARAKNDLRSLSTALEAYFVDNNSYVASASDGSPSWAKTVNSSLGKPASNARKHLTFMAYSPTDSKLCGGCLTSPISFITDLPSDPFADTKKSSFAYWNAMDVGWIAWSYGPDTDEASKSQIEVFFTGKNPYDLSQNSIYNPYKPQPIYIEVESGPRGSYTYDSTNGTSSRGDLWRIKS